MGTQGHGDRGTEGTWGHGGVVALLPVGQTGPAEKEGGGSGAELPLRPRPALRLPPDKSWELRLLQLRNPLALFPPPFFFF